VTTAWTDAEFEDLSWHDCTLWGLAFHPPDPETGDWTRDLVLDIDFIVEWLCGVGGPTRFRVAPAALVFHGITDLRIAVDWGRSGFQVALHEASIDRIEREAITDQKVYLDRPYYRWTIRLNWPKGGELCFGAVGFTQTLLAEPVVTEAQRLAPSERRRLTGR